MSSFDVMTAAELLGAQGAAVVSLCRSLPRAITVLHPPRGGWSISFVASHLLDEEREDFRVRLLSTLEEPGRPWPGIDPESWVASRDYTARDLTVTLDEFVAERARSVEQLRGLGAASWDNVHRHPALGEISARDLLASWLDHDRLHLRQVLRILNHLGESVTPGGRTDYAGGSW